MTHVKANVVMQLLYSSSTLLLLSINALDGIYTHGTKYIIVILPYPTYRELMKDLLFAPGSQYCREQADCLNAL